MKNFQKIIHIFFYLLLIGLSNFLSIRNNPLLAQSVFLNQRFKNYNIRDGLSQNSGRAIIQDKLGNIWIATEIGLNKFNGNQFQIFKHNPLDTNSISNNYINCLLEDKLGNIWIGTDGGGIDVYFPKTQQFKHIFFNDTNKLNENKKNIILALYLSNNGNIWVGTAFGMYEINNNLKVLRHFASKQNNKTPITGNYVISFLETPKGLWFATVQGGLHLLNPNTGEITKIFEKIPEFTKKNVIIKTMFATENNEILLGTIGMGLLLFDPNEIKIIQKFTHQHTEKYSIASDNISAIVMDDKKNFWIATADSGICYFILQEKKFIRFQHEEKNRYSLINNNIRSLCLDASGVLWIGTHFSGIDAYNTKAKPFYHLFSDALKKYRLNGLGAIITDIDGNIWAGSTYGLFRISADYKQFDYFYHQKNNSNSLSNNYVSYLWQAPDKNIWIATDNGLNIYHYKQQKIIRFDHFNKKSTALKDASLWAICPDSTGNVWLGSWGNGIYIVSYKSGEILQHFTSANTNGTLANDNINCIYKDNKNRIWVGAWEGGLHLFNKENNSFINYQHNKKDKNSISHNIIMAITEDKSGTLWISTFGGGINKFNADSGKFVHYTENDGLISNTVFGMLQDKNNNFWISTSNGISKFNPQEKTFKNYDESDGLQSNEFSQWGFCYGLNNNLIFTGVEGLTIFNPDSIYDSKYEPQVHFSDFKIFNKSIIPSKNGFLTVPIQYAKQINITYRESVFSFDFCATDYSNITKIQYAYKMDGYEDNWNYVGNKHSATYTNLNPGNYVFMVKATNADGVWSKAITSIKIYIKPPFWRTNWFYAILIIFILLVINFYIKFREIKLKRDKKILEQKVAERTAEVNKQKQEIEEKNKLLTQQNEEIIAQRDEITLQRNEIEKKNKNITDSIKYALRIQQSLLPDNEFIHKIFPQSFIFYQPKDIVSGDFYWFDYWFNDDEEKIFFTAIDCTGHGVPGAFMSIMAYNLLTKATGEFQLSKPSEILNFLSNGIYSLFRQKSADGKMVKDGMDLALCMYDVKNQLLNYSGAYNQLILIRNNELNEYKADKFPIGEPFADNFTGYTNHEIPIISGDTIYLFSDGFADQFGGEANKKFTIRKLRDLLLSVQNLTMKEQEQQIRETYFNWKGSHEQIDDVLLIGIRF